MFLKSIFFLKKSILKIGDGFIFVHKLKGVELLKNNCKFLLLPELFNIEKHLTDVDSVSSLMVVDFYARDYEIAPLPNGTLRWFQEKGASGGSDDGSESGGNVTQRHGGSSDTIRGFLGFNFYLFLILDFVLSFKFCS